MSQTRYLSILQMIMRFTKYALLVLTILGTGLFAITQTFLTPYSTEVTYTTCEVDPVTNQEKCITVPENKDVVDTDTKASFLKTLITGSGYLIAFSFFTYSAFKFDTLLQELNHKNVFSQKNIATIRNIVLLLVVVPMIYSIVVASLAYYAFSVERMNVFLHAVQIGLANVPLMQFNVSTLILGFALLLTIELIKQGEHYKKDSDLSI